MSETLISANEAARRLGVDVATVYWWARTQKVPVQKEGEHFRFLDADVRACFASEEPLLTTAEVAARLKVSVECFHGMRRRRVIPGIKLGRITWRFRWSEVEAALLETRVRPLLPPHVFRVEPANKAGRPNQKFRVRGWPNGKEETAYFDTEAKAKAHARKRNHAVGTVAPDALPDAWRGKAGAAAWRVRTYRNAAQPNGAKYMAVAKFDGKEVKRFFSSESAALDYANERNAEVAEERLRRRQDAPAKKAGKAAPAPAPAEPVAWQWSAETEPPPLPDEIEPDEADPLPEEIYEGEIAELLTGPAPAGPVREEALTSALTVAARLAAEPMSLFNVYPATVQSCPELKWLVNGYIRGGRVRRYFKNEAQARTYAHLKNTELLNQGRESIEFPTWLRAMAQRCQEMLEPHQATLEDAVRVFLATKARQDKSVSIKVCIEKFVQLKAQEGLTKRHVYNLRKMLPWFAEAIGPEVLVSEISVREVNAYLGTLKRRRDPAADTGISTKRQTRRLLCALFGFAKVHGYCAENPVLGSIYFKEEETEVGIFRPEELAGLLFHAPAEFVPMLAIGAFAGLRSAELGRLEWKDVKLDRGYIEVPARKAKSARRRLVKIQPCLDAWIRPLAKPEGPIAPALTLRPWHHLREAMPKAGLAAWVRNGLRHSFASYHLAQFKDAAALALEMGHTTTSLIFAHYRQLVHESEAERFWNIFPPETAEREKIVNFTAQKAG